MDLPQFQIHSEIEQEHWWFLARRTVMKSLLSRVCPPSKDRLLVDVGCGTGGNSAFFKDDYTCIGIDILNKKIVKTIIISTT